IHVRYATEGEKLTALGGEEITLKGDTLVIADDSQALALAGITGGEPSAVTAGTKDIVLECAFFAPLAVVGKARQYGLHTDSSHRFERGVDAQLQVQAIERATALILELAGGEAGPVHEVVAEEHLPQNNTITLQADKVNQLLGFVVPETDMVQALTALGMAVTEKKPGEWLVQGPSWRFDIAIQEDLVEEIARVYGYDRLPIRLPAIAGGHTVEEEAQLNSRVLADTLSGRGYREVITYSFVDPSIQAVLEPSVAPLLLANPLSRDLSAMRTTLWAGLLPTAQRNINRQVSRLRLFEQGLRFLPGATIEALQQEPMIVGLLYGNAAPRHFSAAPRGVDFYDIKADVEALLA